MELSKKHASDESGLRQKIVELHAHDDAAFDTEPLLATIQTILTHTHESHKITTLDTTSASPAVLLPTTHTLSHLLHKITCVLNCECGRDAHATALEILQLLATYSWEAKIVIVLSAFALEYAQFHLLATLSKTQSNPHPLVHILATLRQIPDLDDDINSKFQTLAGLLNLSIQVSRLISSFGCLPLKHTSDDAEPLALALTQIPLAVYWITRLLIACASEFTGILGFAETKSSYAETWNITSLEHKVATIQTNFSGQLELCKLHIEEKKHIKYVEKVKGMFSQKTVHIDNQKILQTLLVKKKDGFRRPLSCGPDVSVEFGVEALRGKTVLLLISSLEISHEEITKLSLIYNEKKTKGDLQYEIVWLPIVEQTESEEIIEQKFLELKKKMSWHTLVKHSFLKRGLARYVKEEWKYSKKSIMVALDSRGKVVNPNAFHMFCTWGNAVYPFTQKQELSLWNGKTWSLELLVDESSHREVWSWMKEDKIICLYGGEKHEWIEEFVNKTSEIATEAKISVEMVYVGKNTSAERITEITEIVGGNGSICWESTKCTHFWRRIESMMYSKVHHGAKVKTAKEAGDPILGELLNMLTLGDCDQGWALISHGKGLGQGKIARAKGDVMMKAWTEFSTWGTKIEKENFVVALHEYLAGRPAAEHHCNRLILPGMDDIPEIVVCAECHRPMEKYIMYRCCVE